MIGKRADGISRLRGDPHLRKVVDTGKLQQSGNTITEAHEEEPIQGGGVSDFRQIRSGIEAYRRESQNSSDTCGIYENTIS